MTGRIDLYSARERKKLQATEPSELQYDHFPVEFRVKVAHILHRAIPWEQGYMGLGSSSNSLWGRVDSLLQLKHGKDDLSPRDIRPHLKWKGYLLGLQEPALILDTIEAPIRVAIRREERSERLKQEYLRTLGSIIDLINDAFYEHDLGYQFSAFESQGFIDAEIIRTDSDYIHQEAVDPAIATLHGVGYAGPLQEFLEAHREHRQGKHKSAVNEALKAFESTMKAICRDRGIPPADYEKATASKLIKLLVENGVIPNESESFFSGARAVLESGTPTIRNRQAGHGQGPSVVEMRDYTAAFALNIAASAIVFLVAAHRDTADTASD